MPNVLVHQPSMFNIHSGNYIENIGAAALGRKNGDEMAGEEEEGKYPTVHRGDACSGYRAYLV